MASLVKNLTPPFYAAIINDNKNHIFFNDEISPTDKMVSIAPHQPGFLGLETTSNKQGKGLTISYWSDMHSEKAWENKGDKQIRKHFDGTPLRESCAIRVLKINRKLCSIKKLYLGPRSMPKIIISSFVGTLIISSFSLITHLLGYKVVH
jgi:heme-degrading monooxygenase HmoA